VPCLLLHAFSNSVKDGDVRTLVRPGSDDIRDCGDAQLEDLKGG
jgi:hypothetical protein